MLRREFLSALPAPLLAQSRRPNFVVFLSDDMGYADIGPYGATDIRTPHLDRMAQEGVRFTQFYSNGPVCTPTRAALMTGRWQQRYGLEWALVPADKNKGLPATESTIAKMLKDAGYRTGIFGKWHLGMEPEYNPTRNGFDQFFGLTSGNVDMYSHQYRSGLEDLWENETTVKRSGYLTELIADRAAAFIEQPSADPFFCYVPFNAVHWPFQGPGRPQDQRTEKTWYDGTRSQDYKPMLESMDAAIGKVLDAVRRRNQDRDTLVLFTNDNGGERLSDNRPFFHHKQTLWEGGIRVPAIARWAGRLPAGKVTSQPAITMDFTATILAAAGVTPPASRPLDGIDLLPILRGERAEVERTFYWRIDRTERKQKAIRHGNWKFINDGNVTMLVDLAADPGERVDRHAAHPEVTAGLQRRLAAWESDLARNPPPFVVK